MPSPCRALSCLIAAAALASFAAPRDSVRAQIQPGPATVLRGFVVADQSGDRLRSATVTLVRGGSAPDHVTTDAKGAFAIEAPPVPFTLLVSKDTPRPSVELSLEPHNLSCGDAGFTCA